MTVQLPTEKIKATKVDPRFLLIYGAPKIGKTPSLAMLPNNLILDLEEGTAFIDAMKMDIYSLEGLATVAEAIKNSDRKYDYLTVDTATKLEEMCESYAKELYLKSNLCKTEYKNNPAALPSVLMLPEGAGYMWLRHAYGKWVTYLNSLPTKALILVAHVRDKMLVDKRGNEVGSNDISFTGKIKQITCARADAIGYLYRTTVGTENGKAVSQMKINFNSNSEIVCGSRCAHLRGMDFDFYPEKNPEDWKKIFTELP